MSSPIPSCVAILCAKAPPFKVNLRLNPSQSKATTDGGSSRNTTTTVCELAKFRRNHLLTGKALRSICSRKPLQNVHRCRSNERLCTLMVVVASRGPRIRAPPNVIATLIRRHFNGLRGPPVVGAPRLHTKGYLYRIWRDWELPKPHPAFPPKPHPTLPRNLLFTM
jgi:hypothetical protein